MKRNGKNILEQLTPDFLLKVAMGKIPEATFTSKF